ncbi:hypothetical protein T05_3179 [Trichinella murrelli]|uniref:Uncharacterized protein n=1 Tax=Trichinella murrelli TaxID=144512 RepID=A0A0V0T386_9BILA|nr:hypothetical protein T05_3179 [Trichinella murrelli]
MKSKTVPKSQFVAFHGVYHELLEKEAALQNVEDPHMRAELEIQGEPGVWDLWSNQNHFFPRDTDAISTMAQLVIPPGWFQPLDCFSCSYYVPPSLF